MVGWHHLTLWLWHRALEEVWGEMTTREGIGARVQVNKSLQDMFIMKLNVGVHVNED